MQEFSIPAPGPDGVRRVEVPIRVKVFVFWLTVKVQVWYDDRSGKGGVKVL